MASINKNKIWHDVLESIKVSVSSAIYSTWFLQTHLADLSKNNKRYLAEIGCSSTFVKNTLESRYFGLIQDSLTTILGSPCDVVFVVKNMPQANASTDDTPLFKKDEQKTELYTDLAKAGIRASFTFDNFAVSSSNQMAWAAAEAVSKSPSTAYNPLFIWGGVGVGKTHLMNAVGHYIISMSHEDKVICCTGENFTNDIVEGIRSKTTQAVRKKYRRLKALLIDDIQFIAGKDAVQEEFFHTFNALVNAGSQVILTSDRPPSDIAKLEERLRSRFEAGLIVDISPADFELRCAILQIKSKERGISLPMDLIQLISGNIDSARKIEGFLVKLISESKTKKTDIDKDFIESILGKGINDNHVMQRATSTEMISAVSKYYSIKKGSLLGTSRARPIARPRQVLMYLLRTQLSLPYQEVGNIIGGRDHTTVMHAVEKITNLASDNVQIREDLKGIKSLL